MRCPDCDSPQPRMHPSLQADGGEIYHICQNEFHGKYRNIEAYEQKTVQQRSTK